MVPCTKTVFVLLLVLWSLSACSKSGSVGEACQADTDCAAGDACVEGKCVDASTLKKKCDTDEECDFGEQCLDNRCSAQLDAGCTSDIDCEAGFECNSARGQCEPLPGSCSRNGDCDRNESCVNERCTPNGTSDGGPSENPPADTGSCTADSQCNPPSTICQSGQCVSGCSATSCANGQTCSTTTGRCVAGSSGGEGSVCESEEQCATNFVCVAENAGDTTGFCRATCDIYAPDCSGGRVCVYIGTGSEGACLAPTGGATAGQPCSDTVACKVDLLCVPDDLWASTGVCRAYCDPQNATSCANGYCEDWGDVGACIPDGGNNGGTTCLRNSDCTGGQICQISVGDDGWIAKTCEDPAGSISGSPGKTCTTDSQCATGFCFVNSSATQGFCLGACAANSDCASGTVCDALTFDLGGYYDSVDACAPPRCDQATDCGSFSCTLDLAPYDYSSYITRCWPAEGFVYAGDTCWAHEDCESGYCLDDGWGTTFCYGPCLDDWDCSDYSYCSYWEVPLDEWSTTWVSACLPY